MVEIKLDITDIYFYGELLLIVMSLGFYIATDFKITKKDLYGEDNLLSTRLWTGLLWVIILVGHIMWLTSWMDYENISLVSKIKQIL